MDMAASTTGGNSRSLKQSSNILYHGRTNQKISFSEFSGNKLGETGPEESWYVNKRQGEKNKVICNRKSFIKNLCSHCFCFEILFLAL